MIEQIAGALEHLVGDAGAPNQEWVKPYSGGRDEPEHQFVLFFKPEATAIRAGVHFRDIFSIVSQRLEEWHVEAGAVRVLRGDYLAKHHIMDQHYGVINRISHQGHSAISPAAEARLMELFGDDLVAGEEILGGHGFLLRFPAFSPLALSVLSDNIGSTKLAAGTYLLKANVLGKDWLILNAFHPFQLEPYNNPHSAIVVLECTASQPWAALRQRLAGATNPAKAAAGSIRHALLEGKEKIGMRDVSQGANGIHLSAGPLEGMVEVQRFFTDHESGRVLSFEETTFGRQMTKAGVRAETLAALAANPTLSAGGEDTPAFDLTEEVDATEAVKRLASAAPAATE